MLNEERGVRCEDDDGVMLRQTPPASDESRSASANSNWRPDYPDRFPSSAQLCWARWREAPDVARCIARSRIARPSS
jgi:hypothetical protein